MNSSKNFGKKNDNLCIEDLKTSMLMWCPSSQWLVWTPYNVWLVNNFLVLPRAQGPPRQLQHKYAVCNQLSVTFVILTPCKLQSALGTGGLTFTQHLASHLMQYLLNIRPYNLLNIWSQSPFASKLKTHHQLKITLLLNMLQSIENFVLLQATKSCTAHTPTYYICIIKPKQERN